MLRAGAPSGHRRRARGRAARSRCSRRTDRRFQAQGLRRNAATPINSPVVGLEFVAGPSSRLASSGVMLVAGDQRLGLGERNLPLPCNLRAKSIPGRGSRAASTIADAPLVRDARDHRRSACRGGRAVGRRQRNNGGWTCCASSGVAAGLAGGSDLGTRVRSHGRAGLRETPSSDLAPGHASGGQRHRAHSALADAVLGLADRALGRPAPSGPRPSRAPCPRPRKRTRPCGCGHPRKVRQRPSLDPLIPGPAGAAGVAARLVEGADHRVEIRRQGDVAVGLGLPLGLVGLGQ